MPLAFMRANQRSSSGGSHCAWIGRSTAALIANALSHRICAPRSAVGGVPVVSTICLTPSSNTAARATSASCSGVLRAIVRPAASDWPIAQNLQLLAAALVADAGLQHRGRQHVRAMQRGDMRVRHAVERLHAVKARRFGKADIGDRNRAAQQARSCRSRRGAAATNGECHARARMHRHHDRHAVAPSPPCGPMAPRRHAGSPRPHPETTSRKPADCNSVINCRLAADSVSLEFIARIPRLS